MRLTWRLLGVNAAKLLDRYSQFHPSVLTIQQFIDFGKNASPRNSFLFMRKELPVRLANIMKEIHLLPELLLNMPSVQLVEKWYMQSFNEILDFEKAHAEDSGVIKRFNETLDNMRNRHKTVVETMAEGVKEMKEQGISGDLELLDSRVQYFLDRFYMSRISIRMLIHQHLMLFANLDNHPQHIGCIDPSCDILAVAEDAYDNARFLCEQYYMKAPLCEFACHNGFDKTASDERVTMTYVPSHLYHMLFELLKNSLRAVVEYHGEDSDLPSVQVLISKGREDVTIKLSDQGGGIRRSETERLFNYMYSTAPQPPSPDAITTTPLAGYGYGLPLSRLYAKYFNGDLWLNSVDGFGTDAMIALKVFPCDASELLPIYNKTSSLRYTSSAQVGDWSDRGHGKGAMDIGTRKFSTGCSGSSL